MLFRGIVVAGAMAVMLMVPGVAHAACANEEASFASIGAEAAAESLNCLINEERAAAGRPTLSTNSKLTRLSREQADYVGSSGNFSHLNSSGDNPGEQADDLGYNWKAIAQNIVIADTPAEAVDRWVGATEHSRNLFRRKYREIGSGAAGYDSAGNAIYVMTSGVRR